MRTLLVIALSIGLFFYLLMIFVLIVYENGNRRSSKLRQVERESDSIAHAREKGIFVRSLSWENDTINGDECDFLATEAWLEHPNFWRDSSTMDDVGIDSTAYRVVVNFRMIKDGTDFITGDWEASMVTLLDPFTSEELRTYNQHETSYAQTDFVVDTAEWTGSFCLKPVNLGSEICFSE